MIKKRANAILWNQGTKEEESVWSISFLIHVWSTTSGELRIPVYLKSLPHNHLERVASEPENPQTNPTIIQPKTTIVFDKRDKINVSLKCTLFGLMVRSPYWR